MACMMQSKTSNATTVLWYFPAITHNAFNIEKEHINQTYAVIAL